MMCYVGKATKIFIFIVTVIVITGLVLGFGIFGRNTHPKSRKCSGEDCSLSDYSPPPPLQIPFPSLPDPNTSNPSDPIVSSDASPPPPPPEASLPQPPPSVSLNYQSPPPPPSSIPVSVVTPPVAVTPPAAVTPPVAVTAPPPQAVEVSPGPTNSS